MRIAVITSDQTPESSPEHFISKKLAQQFLSYYHNGRKAVERVSDSLIWIRVNLTFGKLKALLKPTPGPVIIPKIKPPRAPEGLLLTYPCRDQRTVSA